MPRSGLTAEQYCERLEKVIKRHGVDKVLARLGLLILYSGPSKDVRKDIGDDPKSNWARSGIMAVQLGGSRLDDTFLGRILWERRLYDYFLKSYAHEKDPEESAEAASLKVWGFVSEQLAKAEFKHAATAVCGADESRVFLKYELAALIENPYVETINGIDAQAFKKMYHEVSPDEAFNLICLTELQGAYLRAKAGAKRPLLAWQDFFERQSFYQSERRSVTPFVAKLTPEQEATKQKILVDYRLTNLYEASSAAWGGPLVPVRPVRSRATPPQLIIT